MKRYFVDGKGKVWLVKGIYLVPTKKESNKVTTGSYFTDICVTHPEITTLRIPKQTKKQRKIIRLY